MPVEYILTDLLSQTDGAVGAIFLDESGETIDLACADLTPYQLRVVAAYVGIQLRQMDRMLGENRLGACRLLQVTKDDLRVYCATLDDGYSLVLIQRAPGVAALARAKLFSAAQRIRQAVFS